MVCVQFGPAWLGVNLEKSVSFISATTLTKVMCRYGCRNTQPQREDKCLNIKYFYDTTFSFKCVFLLFYKHKFKAALKNTSSSTCVVARTKYKVRLRSQFLEEQQENYRN